jgi:hypothetical protein
MGGLTMRIRLGFVSNSSSSSFIIIDHGEQDFEEIKNSYHGDLDPKGRRCIRIPQTFQGETEFGWQVMRYHDFPSKLNWATLLAKRYESRWNMLKAILKKDFSVDAVYDCLDWDEEEEDEIDSFYKWSESGYIDHQSVTDDNAAMFESEETLRAWLYGIGSYIQNGNDN